MTSVSPAIPAYLPRADKADDRLYPARHHSRYAVATRLRQAVERATREYIATLQSPTLLDFGCGDQPYRPVIAPHVARYLGVDLPGNARADFAINPDGSTTAPARIADAVLSTQVLEHVADPAQYLAEAHRLLKPGGRLILSTHGLWLYHPDPTDYWRWTGPGLRRHVEGAGFTTLSLTGVLGLLPAALQLAQDALMRRLLPKRARRLVGPPLALLTQTPFLWLDALHTDAQRADESAVFLIVAQK